MTVLRSFNNIAYKRVLDLLEVGHLRLRKVVVKRITVIKLKVRAYTTTLTNMIIARFGQRRNLVRKIIGVHQS